jgi:23S rRNA U2552 (ribose-2'-O)-methylase RlmE/FtsJ
MNTLLKTKTLELHQNIFNIYGFNILNSNTINKQNFQPDLFKILNKYKNEIDNIDKDVWNKYKSLVNEYEMIFNNKNVKNNVSTYIPISRAYFKLWEILTHFDIVDNKASLNLLCIAEGPGGFVEAIYNYRKKNNNNFNKATCITLNSDDRNIPNWTKANHFLKHNPSIKLVYGVDNTGDIYNPENIKFLINKFKHSKANLITADGGFDFSDDYKNQEQNSYQLIICEIVCALGCLKEGGHFVIKIFEIFTHLTVKIIYFLTRFFKSVSINKPLSSRNLNSEKYLICKDFVGIQSNMIDSLLILLEKWSDLKSQNIYINDIFIFNVPREFENMIKNYNIYYVKNNVYNILKTLTYIKLNLPDSEIDKIKQQLYILASLWCYKNDIGINYKLPFLSREYTYFHTYPQKSNSTTLNQ